MLFELDSILVRQEGVYTIDLWRFNLWLEKERALIQNMVQGVRASISKYNSLYRGISPSCTALKTNRDSFFFIANTSKRLAFKESRGTEKAAAYPYPKEYQRRRWIGFSKSGDRENKSNISMSKVGTPRKFHFSKWPTKHWFSMLIVSHEFIWNLRSISNIL